MEFIQQKSCGRREDLSRQRLEEGVFGWRTPAGRFLALLAACFCPFALQAQIPEPVLPEGVGVNIHFVRGHEKDLDLIAEAGFKFVRMDFGWAAIEKNKGEYNWADYDELTANLARRGLGVIYILDYAHSAYETKVESHNGITHAAELHTASPRHPESIAAFARWATASARHFHGQRVIWEIYNEPNGDFWKPKPNANEYAALALPTAKAIREAEPKATIIGPATSGFEPEFVEVFLKSGILAYLDGVSVHPYRSGQSSPETAVPEYKNLREQIERYAPASKRNKIPILSGEWGYSTDGKDVSPQKQADYAVRQQLCNLLNGVPLSIWYDWENDGPDPSEREHNFGTVTQELNPKPSYAAIRTMTRELRGCKIARRLKAEKENDYLLLLVDRKGGRKIAAWTQAEPHSVKVELTKALKTRFSGSSEMGEPLSFAPEKQYLSIPLDASPKYIALKGARPK